MHDAMTVRLLVADETADAATIEREAQLLRDELLALDVDDVTRETLDAAPEGAKAVELVQLGSLLVTLASSPGLLGQVAELVRSWVTRDERRTVALEVGDAKLTVSGASADEQRRLIDVWVRQVAQRSDTGDAAADANDTADAADAGV